MCAVGDDNKPSGPGEAKAPVSLQQVAAILAAIAAAAAATDPILSLADGDRVAFNAGLCLIILAAAVAVALTVPVVRRNRRYSQWWRHARPASTAAAVVLLFIGGIALVAVSPKTAAIAACRQAATVSGAATSAPAFTVQVSLRCVAPPGQQRYLVEQLVDEGRPGTVKHSEYYLGWDLKTTTARQSFADSPSGCATRRYYVISVTADQLALIQQSHQTSSGSYYGEPIDTVIGKYIISNEETNHTCVSP
jgi:hypothetical protein